MPTVLRIGPYRFHFYSDVRNEPPHIHVAMSEGECPNGSLRDKFWLSPIVLARNKGIRPDALREVEKLIFKHEAFLKEKYYEFHKR